MAPPFEAFFLPSPSGGQRFALHHPPASPLLRGAVLFLHPFAEELNKVRRMAALQSRALAAAGFGVLQLDLRGCGDSSGDLHEVAWSDWLLDAQCGVQWLTERYPQAALWLWGARAGCLLAAEAAARITPAPKLLFWMPVVSGQAHLQQFLRIKVAGDMLGGQGKSGLALVKQTLAAGGAVDVAGYRLPAAVARGLEQSSIEASTRPGCIVWMEVASRAGATLPPAAERLLAACRAAGHPVHGAVVSGPAFWQTTEIHEVPALLDASLAAMQACSLT